MAEFYRSKLLRQFPWCIHAVTTKDTEQHFEGSLALHTGECEKVIIANRENVAKALGLNEVYCFVTADQTHSANITVIDSRESKGWNTVEGAVTDCDALVTNHKGVMLTILTADCVPVLLVDTHLKIVAAVHAGWKGTQANIAGKTVRKMQEVFGSEPKEIAAFVAPSIGRCCYEVGYDVAQHFADPETFEKLGEKYMLDLPLVNKKQLLEEGLLVSNIEMSGVCTACEVENYFSHRKEKGCSGRFMSMIGLVP